MPTLSSLHLAGWKSIRDQRIDFGRINVLIGANGSGKSNLISFLRLAGNVPYYLDYHVAEEGGADSVLYLGTKVTQKIQSTFVLREEDGRESQTQLELVPSPVNRLVIMRHGVARTSQSVEDLLFEQSIALRGLSKIKSFHFSDTTTFSPLRRDCDLNLNREFQSDGNNLPAMLYLYSQKHPAAYRRIVSAVKSVAPFFDDFLLEPLRLNPNRISLRWRAVGKEYEFGPHQLSDGTLRAIALFTLLLAPDEDRPSLIVLDEPELGLHPSAITIFADLVKAASVHSQIVLATQSTTLVDHFEAQDIIAVNSRNGESIFERLDPVRLKTWLEEYSIGELWEQNVIGGGPY